MLQRGRGLFYVLAAGLIVVLLSTLDRLPPVVASHFDGAGVPNGWSSRPAYALLLLAIGILLPFGVTALIGAVTRDGPTHLNIPDKAYWSRPEHSEEAVRRMRAYAWWLGCVMVCTALLVHLLVVAAHAQRPTRSSTSAMLLVIGVVLLAILGWVAGLYRLLRRPRTEGD